MSRHLHARPRRVLAALWDWANQRMERRDVFAHIPQAPDGWSPRDEWAEPAPGTPGAVSYWAIDWLGGPGDPYMAVPVRDEPGFVREIHHPRNLPSPAERTERIKADGVDERRAGEPHLHGQVRAENVATAVTAQAPVPDLAVEFQPRLYDTAYDKRSVARLRELLASDETRARILAEADTAFTRIAAEARNHADYILSGYTERWAA
jgi:hypothetical protein